MKVVAAVSGGVDSCVMLHKLVKHHDVVVAHVDHALRTDSAADARFVTGLAESYGCDFKSTVIKLSDKSEATARLARWDFLKQVKADQKAEYVYTAHHQDDVLETIIINLLRGGERLGLTALKETADIKRPLLAMTKSQIYDYALENRLEWVEDKSNFSDQYLRNRIRRHLTPKLNENRGKLLKLYTNLMAINTKIEPVLERLIYSLTSLSPGTCRLDRNQFNRLDYHLQREVAAKIIYDLSATPPKDSLEVERAAMAAKTALAGSMVELRKNLICNVQKDFILITTRS
jgi:tRNA(Ile)-lysidine synthase